MPRRRKQSNINVSAKRQGGRLGSRPRRWNACPRRFPPETARECDGSGGRTEKGRKRRQRRNSPTMTREPVRYHATPSRRARKAGAGPRRMSGLHRNTGCRGTNDANHAFGDQALRGPCRGVASPLSSGISGPADPDCRRRAVSERPFCGRVSRGRKDSGRGSGNANGFSCRPCLADRSASLAALGQLAARPARGCQSWTDSRRETSTGGCRQLASTSTTSRHSRAESPDAPGIRKFCRMAGRAKSRPGDRATMSGADPPPAGNRRSAERARFPAEIAAFRAQAPRLHPPGAASSRASAASTDGGPRLARDRKRRKAQTMQPVQPVAPIARHAATAAFRAVLQASRRAHGGSETGR